MTRRPRRTSAAAPALVLALLAGLVAGCSGDDAGEDPAPPESGAPSAVDTGVATDIAVGTVRGRLPRARRERLVSDVAAVVDRWIDHAYLGELPRRDVSAAFAGFTRGARADAMRDLRLLSNARLTGVESATATVRRVRLDVAAPRGRAVGVTARVVLAFRTDGGAPTTQRVGGALYLTPRQGWKVFGYDLSRGSK